MLEYWDALSGRSFERAVLGGLAADRLGLAFATGYRSALLSLTGESGHAAVCITEEGGGHPRAIRTRLTAKGDTVVVTGTKQWSTLAGRAQSLLVAASIGEREGRNRLKMVRVPVDAKGLTLHAMPPTPFIPEIPHFRLTLEEVSVPAEAVLEGDGYGRWIKPFRTVEDIHVVAAAAAHVVGVGRHAGWPAAALAEGLVVLGALSDLSERPPLDPATHLALGGVLTTFDRWLDRCNGHWEALEEPVRARWARDRGVLGVAGRVRAARFARAVEGLGLATD